MEQHIIHGELDMVVTTHGMWADVLMAVMDGKTVYLPLPSVVVTGTVARMGACLRSTCTMRRRTGTRTSDFVLVGSPNLCVFGSDSFLLFDSVFLFYPKFPFLI